ncbi:GNAT family N-acetyltransferase [Sphingomonas cavernae]|uniref:N-acetyltransferase n=1 Tax=Sphingomonas cavernae TaxID=2320861 RepID=A0A418W632_9SPHN|nr:GNAT family N-acetyltransferase [Sphingomonas cavernae]RJF85449.1 N-acetyltransferase [Sphingomonas cavernae]
MLPTLQTERLVLRPLVEDDAGAMYLAFRDAELMQWWSSGPHVDETQTRTYLNGTILWSDRKVWAITEDGGEALGYVALGARREGVKELGYLLRRSHWGRGYAREAVAAIIDHGFNAMKLRRIFADVDPDNLPSVELLKRLGFRQEGHLRAEWETHIGVRDSLIFGLLAEEWR